MSDNAKRGKLRWKRQAKETGLAAVGAGPYRASDLHDGVDDYATVYPKGGNWCAVFEGWFWVCSTDPEHGIEYHNTCRKPIMDEDAVKAEAMAYIKSCLERNKNG